MVLNDSSRIGSDEASETQIKIMKSPTAQEIAESFDLWQQYVDPSGIDTEESFNAKTIDERIQEIQQCFPE